MAPGDVERGQGQGGHSAFRGTWDLLSSHLSLHGGASHPGAALRFRARQARILPPGFLSRVVVVLSVDVSELQFLPVKVGADVSYFRSQREGKYTHTVQSLSLLGLFLRISWWSILLHTNIQLFCC